MAAALRRFGSRAVWVRDSGSTGRYGSDWESEYGSIYKRPARPHWSGLLLWSDRVRVEVQWLDGAPEGSDCLEYIEAYKYLEALDFRL